MSSRSCVQFTSRTEQIDPTAYPTYIHFLKGDPEECFTYIDLTGTGAHNITLGKGCLTTVGTVEHEVMHALGFRHEHQRPDRDAYITIIENNIQTGRGDQFDIEPSMDTSLPYDFHSVLHYPANAFSINKDPTIIPKESYSGQVPALQNYMLSNLDIQRIESVYCPETTTSNPLDSSLIKLSGWKTRRFNLRVNVEEPLQENCLLKCKNTHNCRSVLINPHEKECHLLRARAEENYKFVPDNNYYFLTEVKKRFARYNKVYYVDGWLHELSAVNNPTFSGSDEGIDTCQRLCHIHPRCNAATLWPSKRLCMLFSFPLGGNATKTASENMICLGSG